MRRQTFSTQFLAYNGTLILCKIIDCTIYRFKTLVCIWIVTIRYREKRGFTIQNSKESRMSTKYIPTPSCSSEDQEKIIVQTSAKQNQKWMKGVSISPWLKVNIGSKFERFEADEFKNHFSESPFSGKHFFHVLKKVSSIIWININFKIYCHYCTVYVRPRSKTGRMIFLFLVWMMIVSRMCARCW